MNYDDVKAFAEQAEASRDRIKVQRYYLKVSPEVFQRLRAEYGRPVNVYPWPTGAGLTGIDIYIDDSYDTGEYHLFDARTFEEIEL